MLSRFPYPLEKGDKLRAFHQIKELSKYYSITLITTTDISIKKESIEQLRKYCTTIYLLKLSKISIFFNLFIQLFTNKPFQIGYFYSSKNKFRIKKILSELKPDHIYCQLVRVAEFVKEYHNCPKTLDYMDAFSKGIERRVENANFFKKWLFKKEAKRLSLYERQIFDYFENHTIISKQDQEYILHPKRKSIACIQNGVDSSFFEIHKKTDEFDFVFIGNMSYQPNIEAVHYIVDEILPLINTPKKTFSLLISGATPHSSILKLARNNSNIKITGWVDDIRSSYLKGKIFLAPMMIGTGMQNKLIEAMALGLPCITTSLANNAINGIHNESILVAEDKFEFVDSIMKLTTDNNFYLKISEGGRKLALSNFNWEKSTKKLINLIDKK